QRLGMLPNPCAIGRAMDDGESGPYLSRGPLFALAQRSDRHGCRYMTHELLRPAEMAEADRLTIEAGPFDGIGLMRRAGAGVAAVVLKRYPAVSPVHVLCGPGNNGGDGYVAAKLLHEAGVEVLVWMLGAPKPGTDAALAAAECPVVAKPLAGFEPAAGSLIVD